MALGGHDPSRPDPDRSVNANGNSWHTRPVLLPITAEVLVEEAERLGEGGHRYTSRQLYYAVCRAVERPAPSITGGLIGLGSILLLLAGALLFIHSIPISPFLAALGVVVLLAAPLNTLTERGRERRRALASRPLAAAYDEFLTGALADALRSRPDAFDGLVATGPPPAVTPPPAPEAPPGDLAGSRPDPGQDVTPGPGGWKQAGPMVVCDRRETADLFAANAGRLPDGAAVTELGALLGEDGGGLAPAVRGRLMVAVHDAGPAGCALMAILRRAGALHCVDAGLRPPPSDQGLQVIEGAPARLPAGLEDDLTAVERGWLSSGRRLELATLTPAEAVALVVAACEAPGGVPPSRS